MNRLRRFFASPREVLLLMRSLILSALALQCAGLRVEVVPSLRSYAATPRACACMSVGDELDGEMDALLRVGVVPSLRPYAATPRACACMSAGDELDGEMDALLKRELENAFQGLQGKVELDASEEAQFALIEQETQRILGAVLEELDAGGDALRAKLEAKAAKMAGEETRRMMSRVDQTSATVDATLAATRATVREEMAVLKDLKTEYDQLEVDKAADRKSGLFGTAAFIAGLAYVAAGLNDLLRVATGSSSEETAIQGAAELALGAVGIFVYQSRQNAKNEKSE